MNAIPLSPPLLPTPAKASWGSGGMAIDSSFAIVLPEAADPILERAARRLIDRISRETGLPFTPSRQIPPLSKSLRIVCSSHTSQVQSAVEDESYTLQITPERALLEARTPYGILRGMETILQLLEATPDGFSFRSTIIEDRPRFPWRGLLIDACRHWMPLDVVRRNLDGMAAMKMNVLHWHLSEDQGFRVESHRFPRLHEMGSDGNYYTQNDIRGIIAYASDRGIRVIPEFDMPGHATAWFVGHPELASAPGPYEIERHWGIHDPTMDPTREEVYTFLDAFIGEMVSLFPDRYFHIGGDEVTGTQWDNNPRIAHWKNAHGMKSNQDLQAHFNRRLFDILKKHGKRMVGWDEVLHPDLPTDIVVQSWRGQNTLASSANDGHQGILSFGYYLDQLLPASFHYSLDPLGDVASALSTEAQQRILGGEACLWGEMVTAENIDSRIWPRGCAVAERLWSSASVIDVDDMYRRMAIVSERMQWLGLTHQSNYSSMLKRIAGYRDITALRTLADILEPMKLYTRHKQRTFTSYTPLTGIADAVRPESDAAREFGALVTRLLAHPDDAETSTRVEAWLRLWKVNHYLLLPFLRDTHLLKELEPISLDVSLLATLGVRALGALRTGDRLHLAEVDTELLMRVAAPRAEVFVAIDSSIRKLLEAVR